MEPKDFGEPEYFQPDAVGVPGNRRFRIIVRANGMFASLWLEKEQLIQIKESFQQMLVQITGNDVLRDANAKPAPPPIPREEFPATPDLDMQVGPIALGPSPESDAVIFLASPLELVEREGQAFVNDEVEPAFRAALTTELLESFIADAEGLLEAGRPRCPLCGQVLNYVDEPHGCIKQNGHRHIN